MTPGLNSRAFFYVQLLLCLRNNAVRETHDAQWGTRRSRRTISEIA
jgi:hypothetical protein